MEEKRKSHNGIYIFIIILLLCVIAGMWYYYNIFSETENTKKTNTTIKSSKKNNENAKIILNNSIPQFLDNADVISLLKDRSNKTEKNGILYEVSVKNISKENDEKYLITAYSINPIEITQEDYEELVETGDCGNVLSLSGTYVESDEQYGDGQGYGFVELYGEDYPRSVYEIVKIDEGYAFRSIVGPGYPLNNSFSTLEFYLDSNTKIYVYDEVETTLEEYAEVLEEKLSEQIKPIITVEYQDGAICLHELGI